MPWFIEKENKDKLAKVDLWVRCGRCKAHIFKQEWTDNLKVCPKCNFHGRLTAHERIEQTLDEGSFVELCANISPADPLQFFDSKVGYKEAVERSQKKTGLRESVVTGTGAIDGKKAAVAVMDFRFLGGSLGSGVGEKILRTANHALENKLPYIVFSASGGARMHEGILSLMQMAKTCAGIARLHTARIPYISVLTDPTTGGVSASYAMVGDVNIAEPGALIGFAGRRVIEQTIKEKLPDNFQTAEYLLEHGFLDSIVERSDMKRTLSMILSYYCRQER
ncbi:MAG: acetyl-CoA carboxylase, carboxyltransferase subunit beta [Geobacteraceae bacterium]